MNNPDNALVLLGGAAVLVTVISGIRLYAATRSPVQKIMSENKAARGIGGESPRVVEDIINPFNPLNWLSPFNPFRNFFGGDNGFLGMGGGNGFLGIGGGNNDDCARGDGLSSDNDRSCTTDTTSPGIDSN